VSTSYSEVIQFKCFNDCKMQGCPGHTLRLVRHNTSDTFSVEIDGKAEYHFDPTVLDLITKLYREQFSPAPHSGEEGGK